MPAPRREPPEPSMKTPSPTRSLMRRSPFPTARRAAGVALTLVLALALSACGGGGSKKEAKGGTKDATSSTAPDKVQGSVASYDLAVGPPSRFILGIFNEAKGPVGYGTLPFSFFFLGE